MPFQALFPTAIALSQDLAEDLRHWLADRGSRARCRGVPAAARAGIIEQYSFQPCQVPAAKNNRF